MERISVVFTGDLDSPEFAAARARLAGETDLRTLPLAEAAEALEQTGAALVVVGKAFPEQFSPGRIEALRRAAPLARLVALEGSWCESESRTGRTWPGVVRISWSAAEAALHREVETLAADQPSRWSGPATAAPFEAALWESELPLARGAGRVTIHAGNAEHSSWLAGACREFGYEPFAIGPDFAASNAGQPIETRAAIWQAPRLAGERDQENSLARFTSAFAAPTLVLLDFPRPQDVSAAESAGASRVLGLPCSWLDLSTALFLAIRRGL